VPGGPGSAGSPAETNLSSQAIDLRGWTLSDTHRGPLDIGTVLDAGQRVLQPGDAVAVQPLAPLQLSNRGGVIVLYQPDGKRLDRLCDTQRDVEERRGRPLVFAYSY